MLDFPKNVLKNKDLHPKFPFFIEKFVKICLYSGSIQFDDFFFPFFPGFLAEFSEQMPFQEKPFKFINFTYSNMMSIKITFFFSSLSNTLGLSKFQFYRFFENKIFHEFCFQLFKIFGDFSSFIFRQKKFLIFVQKIVSSYF